MKTIKILNDEKADVRLISIDIEVNGRLLRYTLENDTIDLEEFLKWQIIDSISNPSKLK